MLTSFVTESPLTGPRRRRLHARPRPATRTCCSTSSSPSPGPTGSSAAPSWSRSRSTSPPTSPQVFNVGAASCGVPGTAGRALARRCGASARCRSRELAAPGGRGSRARACRSTPSRPTSSRSSTPILTHYPEGRGDLRARRQTCSARATCSGSPSSATRSSGYGSDGAGAVLPGRGRRGGLRLGARARRHPRRRATSPPTSRSLASRCAARFRGREVLTNPPPSSGGILIAYALELLERRGRRRRRGPGRGDGGGPGGAHGGVPRRASTRSGFAARFLEPDAAERPTGSARPPTSPPSTATACCASVTCSNGTGSGVIVPGTGVHVNNMLGEQDLNPLGFHRYRPGAGCRR